jgi:hypothetical protein
LRVEFVFERGDHTGMIMADIVDAIAGNEIQNPPPVGRMEFGADAARILDVHLQYIEQPHPLRVHVFFVERFAIRDALCFQHRTFPLVARACDAVRSAHRR